MRLSPEDTAHNICNALCLPLDKYKSQMAYQMRSRLGMAYIDAFRAGEKHCRTLAENYQSEDAAAGNKKSAAIIRALYQLCDFFRSNAEGYRRDYKAPTREALVMAAAKAIAIADGYATPGPTETDRYIEFADAATTAIIDALQPKI